MDKRPQIAYGSCFAGMIVEYGMKPHYVKDTLAFMFETRMIVRPTRFALESKIVQHEYYECWQGLQRHYSCERSEK